MADRLRKAVHNLTDDELANTRRAYAEIMNLRDNRGYGQAAGFHGSPNFWCWHHEQRGRDGRGPLALFLPWHRAYLYDFEMRLRDRVDSVSLPWWDWTHDPGIPPAFGDDKAGDGSANPLQRGFVDLPQANPPLRHWTQRDPDSSPLPTQHDIDQILGNPDFLQFTDTLEGQIHDRVHGWVGGDMGIVAVAAFDPIFWSHHCMVDRLWSIWQNSNGISRIPPSMLDEVLEPFRFTVRQVLDVEALNYQYAASEATVAVGG